LLINIVFIILGLVGLYFGGDWLVEGASKLARSFGLSTLVVGLTVVAFGTSSPELLVSLSAALNGNSDISIGNVVGSNIANVGLILGATGLVFPIAVHVGLLRREIPMLFIITIGSAVLIADGLVSSIDGAVMVMGLIVFNILMIYLASKDRIEGSFAEEEAAYEGEDEPIKPSERGKEVIRLLLGLGVLLIGAQLMVQGSVEIARDVGVSELVIGITLVAVGTSLPELATSIIAAMNQQSDIAIGNVVGSNIYNLLGILGLTAVIRPINVDERVIQFDGLVMIGFTLLLLPFVWNRQISRNESLLLLAAYFTFTIYTFVS